MQERGWEGEGEKSWLSHPCHGGAVTRVGHPICGVDGSLEAELGAGQAGALDPGFDFLEGDVAGGGGVVGEGGEAAIVGGAELCHGKEGGGLEDAGAGFFEAMDGVEECGGVGGFQGFVA